MNNNLIPFDWVKFEQGYKVIEGTDVEIERYKFSNGKYAILLESGLMRQVSDDCDYLKLLSPTVYNYCNVYKNGTTGEWWHDYESMKTNCAIAKGAFHSYLRGEFVNDELVNIEIIKR